MNTNVSLSPTPASCCTRLNTQAVAALLTEVRAPAPSYYTLHPTPYALHPTPYTLHPTPYTLHP